MGMRPIDIIAIVGKTHDAAQAVQANARSHGTMQDHIAARQAAKADLASEQVRESTGDDRLELSTEENGANGGGGDTGYHSMEEEAEDELDDRTLPPEHQIDFLA